MEAEDPAQGEGLLMAGPAQRVGEAGGLRVGKGRCHAVEGFSCAPC